MIKLKLLLETINSDVEESSEELYGIRNQPPDTCTLINNIQNNAKKLTNIMRGYIKLDDVDKLHDILWEIEYFLDNDIIGGKECSMELIRKNVENIRGWGQEWKDYSKNIDPKIPIHQRPENLPKWGSLT